MQLLFILFIKLQYVHQFIISRKCPLYNRCYSEFFSTLIIIINIPSLLTTLPQKEKKKENNKGNILKAQYFFCFSTLNLHIHLQ